MSRRASNDDMKTLVQWARDQGCEVILPRSGHYRITYEGRLVGSIPQSPSDPRSFLNARSFIRRNLNKIKESQTDA